jgi:glycosyltransferase involved in cell wall biosynthesis
MDQKKAVDILRDKTKTHRLGDDIIHISKNRSNSNLPIRVYSSFFIHPDRKRQSEYEMCLLGNRFLEQHVFVDTNESEEWVHKHCPSAITHKRDGIQTFKTLFENGEEGYINIVINADILLDETVFRLRTIDLDNTFLCLGRWEEDTQLNIVMPFMDIGAQDMWVWKGKLKNSDVLTFNLGTPGCDNKITFEMYSAGYKIGNTVVDIVSLHKHASNIRSYPQLSIAPPYATVNPSILHVKDLPLIVNPNRLPFQRRATILHIGYPMSKFQEQFYLSCDNYIFIHHDTPNLDSLVLKVNYKFNISLVFCQLQGPGVLKLETIQALRRGSYLINWTGDARRPIPQWYKTYAPYFDITLFSNETDVCEMKALGYTSEFFNIGFEDQIYTPNRGLIIKSPEIVFAGNNYVNVFPLSQLRSDMVNTLKKEFGSNFGVWGVGWEDAQKTIDDHHEAYIYRSSKMAISLSHYDLERYFSDRMLRIMGCSTLCLAKWYPGIEKDFIDGIHLVVWKTIPELIVKIKYYLKHPEEAFVIARGGYQQVIAEHTWKNRVDHLEYIIQANKRTTLPGKPSGLLRTILTNAYKRHSIVH